jgi:hypothetical protein
VRTIVAKAVREGATVEQWDRRPIPMEQWGKDHWSTFAYAETRAVDHKGALDNRHLRDASSGYPTRLKGNVDVVGHGDLECLEDADEEGLLHITAGALVVVFTDKGLKVAGGLRAHKAQGGNFATFDPTPHL